jgi:long-chain acyl-CoA synthetase
MSQKTISYQDTLPKNFIALVKSLGSQTAMRKKRFGIWQEYSWQASYQQVHDFALGLLASGLERGGKIAILGENDPEAYWAEYAIQSAGLVSVALFPDMNPEELEFFLNHADVLMVVTQGQEQVDKLMQISEELPQLKKIIYWNKRGMSEYQDPWLIDFESFQSQGREWGKSHPGAFEESIQRGMGEDTAILSYTSGTTDTPKGALITHANLLSTGASILETQSLQQGDNYVSFNPLAWIVEQSLGVTLHVLRGTVINFPEEHETIRADLREIAPQLLVYPSRSWESLLGQIQARIDEAHWSSKFLYRLLFPVRSKIIDLADQGKAPNIGQRVLSLLGDLLLFDPIRDKFGLQRVDYAYTSGAFLGSDLLRYARALGVPLLQLYMSAEGGAKTLHTQIDTRLNTLGKPAPGVEVKILENGEIAAKGQGTFKGYHKEPDLTAKSLVDGWFSTGDTGELTKDGYLVFLGDVSPEIEGRIKFNPFVQDVMVIGGGGKPYHSALVTINFGNTARWAERRGIPFTTIVDLSQKVYALVENELAQVNRSLPAESQVKKFVILPKTFDVDESELTHTRKLRRLILEERYQDVLDAIYADRDTVTIRSRVSYQDGRSTYTDIDLAIQSVGAKHI